MYKQHINVCLFVCLLSYMHVCVCVPVYLSFLPSVCYCICTICMSRLVCVCVCLPLYLLSLWQPTILLASCVDNVIYSTIDLRPTSAGDYSQVSVLFSNQANINNQSVYVSSEFFICSLCPGTMCAVYKSCVHLNAQNHVQTQTRAHTYIHVYMLACMCA